MSMCVGKSQVSNNKKEGGLDVGQQPAESNIRGLNIAFVIIVPPVLGIKAE